MEQSMKPARPLEHGDGRRFMFFREVARETPHSHETVSWDFVGQGRGANAGDAEGDMWQHAHLWPWLGEMAGVPLVAIPADQVTHHNDTDADSVAQL